jgi:hypothetical protein
VAGTGPKSEVNPVEPSPTTRGLGEGAAGGPAAGGAPTKCVELYYRRNIKMPGRTQYYVIRVDTWEIVEPTRVERSRTKAHGRDIYCLPKEVWDKTITVLLEQSNSGKLHFEVLIPHAEFEKYKQELEYILARRRGFWDMEVAVEAWVGLRRRVAQVLRNTVPP